MKLQRNDPLGCVVVHAIIGRAIILKISTLNTLLHMPRIIPVKFHYNNKKIKYL
jgi:hypothetical protein